MRRRPTPTSSVQVVRFTPRIAGQCAAAGSRHPERIVCDTIVNGTRRSQRRTGQHGGPIYLFEKAFPKRKMGAETVVVSVLGEVSGGSCFALRLRSGLSAQKIWSELGFLNRAGSK